MKSKTNIKKLLRDSDIVTDIGAAPFSYIKSDVPVASARNNNSRGEIFEKTSVESEGSSVLKVTEISIIGKSNVALRVAIDDHNVAVVKVFSGMDEFHKEGGDFNSLYSLHNSEIVQLRMISHWQNRAS